MDHVQGDLLAEVADRVPVWDRALVEQAIVALALTGRTFTSDDVWLTGVPMPANPNALGAMFSGLRKRGVIACVGYVPSQREGRNGGVIRQWVGAHCATDAA